MTPREKADRADAIVVTALALAGVVIIASQAVGRAVRALRWHA